MEAAMRGALASIGGHLKREPLAGMAILLTATLSILQSDWFGRLFESSVELDAYYSIVPDGRCSLVALSVENKTRKAVSDIRVSIVADWLTKSGREELLLFDRHSGMIGPGEDRKST